MRSAGITPNQIAARGKAMVARYLKQRRVLGLLRRVKNDSDVHHDIDENAVLRYE